MRRTKQRDERGATAVVTVVLAVVIFGCAALAIDIATLAMERQQLHDHIDSAAHAGAYELPADGSVAQAAAIAMAKSQDPEVDPAVDLLCVVASTGASRAVRVDQIPSTCMPGPPPYTAGTYPGLRCNEKICAIPCPPSGTCNTVRVSDSKEVPYGFANVFGLDHGDTGSVASAACKGSCGEEAPNPMDVVFMADRTPSMSEANRGQMKGAILASLTNMAPTLHYVAFGALHKSDPTTSCSTEEQTGSPTAGDWVPLEFTDDYLTSAEAPTLNTASDLVQGISCLPASDSGNFGTHLASSFKGAARYLLDDDNLSHLPARPGTPKKVLIFETDGMPDEVLGNGYRSFRDDVDFGAGPNGSCRGGYRNGWCRDYRANGNGTQGCKNLVRMADEAKDEGITVITIGFGGAATEGCDVANRSTSGLPPQSTGPLVRTYLAQAASDNPTTGTPSTAGDCSSTAGKSAENTDGDYFFCATDGSELADIFATAVSQVSSGIRLLQLP